SPSIPGRCGDRPARGDAPRAAVLFSDNPQVERERRCGSGCPAACRCDRRHPWPAENFRRPTSATNLFLPTNNRNGEGFGTNLEASGQGRTFWMVFVTENG